MIGAAKKIEDARKEGNVRNLQNSSRIIALFIIFVFVLINIIIVRKQYLDGFKMKK